MIQIIRLRYHDDSNGSTSIDVMVCSSKDCAKEIILNEINKGFEESFQSLNGAATELNNDLTSCTWDAEDETFSWYDNGKGETYIIGDVNVNEVNTKFQIFGEIV